MSGTAQAASTTTEQVPSHSTRAHVNAQRLKEGWKAFERSSETFRQEFNDFLHHFDEDVEARVASYEAQHRQQQHQHHHQQQEDDAKNNISTTTSQAQTDTQAQSQGGQGQGQDHHSQTAFQQGVVRKIKAAFEVFKEDLAAFCHEFPDSPVDQVGGDIRKGDNAVVGGEGEVVNGTTPNKREDKVGKVPGHADDDTAKGFNQDFPGHSLE